MNTISRFYTTTFTVKRQSYTGNKSELATVGTFDGHIQQATAEMEEFIGINWAHAFTVWCDDSVDVREGDQLTDPNGETYEVKLKQENLARGDNKHFELTVERNIDEPVSV